MRIVLDFGDGAVWYDTDELSICHDPYGLADTQAAFDSRVRRRPSGDYVLVKNPRLAYLDFGEPSSAGADSGADS